MTVSVSKAHNLTDQKVLYVSLCDAVLPLLRQPSRKRGHLDRQRDHGGHEEQEAERNHEAVVERVQPRRLPDVEAQVPVHFRRQCLLALPGCPQTPDANSSRLGTACPPMA